MTTSRITRVLATGAVAAALCGLTGTAAATTPPAVRRRGRWGLTGRKRCATGPLGASYPAVAAVTDAAKGYKGISIFLVDNDAPGFEKVRDTPVLSRTWGIEQEVKLENVEVPAENLLGDEGAGFEIAQHQFNRFRMRLGGLALGVSERSQALAVGYATKRPGVGKSLGSNQAVS